MAKRKTLSKALRFSVFSRDGFQCRYCGAQSDQAKLVIDHLVPLAQGGDNDIENLITSCEQCNAGKGARRIDQHVPSDSDRLRRAQEMQEQRAAMEAVRLAKQARDEMREFVLDYWCEAFDETRMDKVTLNIIASYALRYGPARVCQWIDSAARHVRTRKDAVRGAYVSGCRRRAIEQGDIPDDRGRDAA